MPVSPDYMAYGPSPEDTETAPVDFTNSQVEAALRVWWDVPEDETLLQHVEGRQLLLDRSLAEMRKALEAARDSA